MKNAKVILVTAVVVILGVGATFLLSSSSGLKGDFYSRSQGVKDITRDPMSRKYSSRITDDLKFKAKTRVTKMDYTYPKVTYDANGFSNQLADGSKMRRGDFLHAIVTTLNPPDIDSYTNKCDFAGSDLDKHWTKRDFCYVMLHVVAPGFEDFIPKFNKDQSKSIYEPDGFITRKDAANLVAEAFMGGKVGGLEYWDYLTNLSSGGPIGYCTTTKYTDVAPDSNPPGTYGGDAEANLLFYTTNALIKMGILPEPSQVPKSDKNALNYPKCHIDSFGPNGPLVGFHAKLWVSLAKSNVDKKYWVK